MAPSSPCTCCDHNIVTETNNDTSIPLVITTSVFKVSLKEIFILILFLLLLFYSVASFLKNWNKNYRYVNYFPHFPGAVSKINETGHRITKCVNNSLLDPQVNYKLFPGQMRTGLAELRVECPGLLG